MGGEFCSTTHLYFIHTYTFIRMIMYLYLFICLEKDRKRKEENKGASREIVAFDLYTWLLLNP